MSKKKLELTWYNKDKALISSNTGRYSYRWVDGDDPRYCEIHTLVLDEYVQGTQTEKQSKFEYSERANYAPQTDNLMILGESGDVLEALTRVPELVKKYAGQVKLVYIDPPFNTGKTFPNYEDNLEHSIWLTMMRDRLLNIRKLLRNDGSIWVHLDDSEVHRMRSLMDEIFGQENFISEIIWEKRTTRENRSVISVSSDFILLYAKHKDNWSKGRNLLTRSNDKGYDNPDNDPRGPWTSVPFTAQFNPEENERITQRYVLTTQSGDKLCPPPGSVWRFTEKRYEELKEDNRIWFGKNGSSGPRLKKYLSEVQSGFVPNSLWKADEVDTTDKSKREIQQLFPGKEAFSTPKPERLLERIIHIATNPGDLVLDCFAGSGTTAAVAQKMGRRWVTCELVEDTFENFTKARLIKVIMDEDDGGITRTSGKRISAKGVTLPEGMNADEAQKFNYLLNKVVREHEELKKDATVKTLKNFTKTHKTKEVVNWRGGGGFQIAHLSPTCFDIDETTGRVILTDDAKGQTLTVSVAAQLRFSLTLDHPYFDGLRGRTRLKVYEGILSKEMSEYWLNQLEEGENLLIAATGIMEGVREAVRKAGMGSKVIHVPDDLFSWEKEEEV